MSATDNLNKVQFYHGTSGANSFRPGDEITPEAAGRPHVYCTTSLDNARNYARWGRTPDGPQPGKVYEVRPEGEIEHDPTPDPYSAPGEDGLVPNKTAYRTAGKLRVIGEA